MNLEGLQTSVIFFFYSQGSSVTHVPTFQDLSDFFLQERWLWRWVVFQCL